VAEIGIEAVAIQTLLEFLVGKNHAVNHDFAVLLIFLFPLFDLGDDKCPFFFGQILAKSPFLQSCLIPSFSISIVRSCDEETKRALRGVEIVNGFHRLHHRFEVLVFSDEQPLNQFFGTLPC
jgi:hypothetical protein